MKLVEILARELKEWPEGAERLDQSVVDCELYGYAADYTFMELGIFLSELSDNPQEEVTRAEWQAAVDALNNPDAVGWDGVGLPPPGTDCEFLVLSGGDSPWVEGEILYSSPYTVVISGNGFEHVHHPHTLKFRPIRTPEQIAAEERKEAIDKLVQFFMNYYGNPKGAEQYLLICRSLHDAGYRKQEQP